MLFWSLCPVVISYKDAGFDHCHIKISRFPKSPYEVSVSMRENDSSLPPFFSCPVQVVCGENWGSCTGHFVHSSMIPQFWFFKTKSNQSIGRVTHAEGPQLKFCSRQRSLPLPLSSKIDELSTGPPSPPTGSSTIFPFPLSILVLFVHRKAFFSKETFDEMNKKVQ